MSLNQTEFNASTYMDNIINSSDSYSAIDGFVYYGEAVVEPTILAVGVVTNAISAVILKGSKIPLNLRVCIISLTLSDLLATIFGFSQITVEVVHFDGNISFGYWSPLGVANYALFFIFMMFMCVSASIVILLAVIRCCLVLKPIASRRFLTTGKTKLLCFLTALVVFILYLPTITNILWQSCYKEEDEPICLHLNETITITKLGGFANKYLYMLSALFGPLLVLIYLACFIAIKITLGRSRDILMARGSVSEGHTGSTRHQGSVTARVTQTLLAILILDTVCTIPTVIQCVALLVAPHVTVFDESNKNYNLLDVIAEIFLCLKPTYNFWLYACIHKEFQRRGLEILRELQKYCPSCPECFRAPESSREAESTSSRTHSTLIHDNTSVTPPSPGSKHKYKVLAMTQINRNTIANTTLDSKL